MSIRRPRGPKPALKHLAFLEAMIEQREQSIQARALRASFLTLRLFDEWMLQGAMVTDGTSPMLRATRAAVEGLQDDGDLQYLLGRIVDGMLMLRDSHPSAVLPRLAALADLFARRGQPALAADIDLLVGSPAVLAARASAPTEAAV